MSDHEMEPTQRPWNGRLYLYPAPEDAAHPGYRGKLRFWGHYGVVVAPDECEYLPDAGPGVYDVAWEPVERDTLIPWHRIDQIEFSDEWKPAHPERQEGPSA
jgi:hypothetical protein